MKDLIHLCNFFEGVCLICGNKNKKVNIMDNKDKEGKEDEDAEKELEKQLHFAGLDAYHDYVSMGKSAHEWHKFRLKITKSLLAYLKKGWVEKEILDIEHENYLKYSKIISEKMANALKENRELKEKVKKLEEELKAKEKTVDKGTGPDLDTEASVDFPY